MSVEYVEDVPGSDHLQDLWGSDRFRGWYQTKTFKRTEHISLEKDDLTYKLNVFNFQYRFIIPARVEFYKGLNSEGKMEYGIIDYTLPERMLGVFRYPLGKDGFFSSPIRSEKLDNILNLSEDEIKDLIKDRKVLTFEAFRIPYHGFDYFLMTENNFKEIEKLAGDIISNSIRDTYEKTMAKNVSIVKEKIEENPNNLSILQNILDRKYTDEKDISTMTENVVHFGI